jgi:3-oxoacyl-[acyl-carrier-protein] synthase II
VTGLGAVTPLASDLSGSWSRLLAGEGSCASITSFALYDQPVRIACEAAEFEPRLWLNRRRQRRTDRFAQLAVAAARMAETDARLEAAREPDRIGASIATAQGGVASLAACCAGAAQARIHPNLVTAFMPKHGALVPAPRSSSTS